MEQETYTCFMVPSRHISGALCELDVNECNMSKPCLMEVLLIMRKPGFSCSCFAGYTGRSLSKLR